MVGYYEMRKRVMAMVIDMVSKDRPDGEIIFAAFAKYGASEKMVRDMIEKVLALSKEKRGKNAKH